MNGLAVNQETIGLALFDPLARVPAPVGDVGLRTRTDFRRTDIAAFLVRALAARYPVVHRLIGDDSFLDVARRFVATQPPRLPLLVHFGETFPHYLRSLGDGASFEYIADIADLEAARAHAYHSADAAPVNARAFSFLSAARFDAFGVALHPSVSLVMSRFPIVTIWKTNQADDGGRMINRWRPEAALIVRPFLDVDVLLLPAGGHAFMAALSAGATISAAIVAAIAQDPDFDLAANLTMLVEANIVVGLRRRRERRLQRTPVLWNEPR